MIAPAPPQQRLPELISRLGALLEEIDDATGGQVDALVDPAGQVSWLLRGAQEALVRQEQEFRALAENSADLILRVSPGLRVLYANPAALGMRGEPLETLRGTPLHVVTGGEAGTDELQAEIQEVVATGQPREAIREGLLALLSSLEAKRLARPDRVKTNRELVGELPGRGASAQLTGEVERLVRWYDRAFYSLEPVPPEDAARFVDEVERLHQGLAGAAA